MDDRVYRHAVAGGITARVLHALVFALLLCIVAPSFAEVRSYPVKTLTEEWVDTTRDDRPVPIKAYLPADATEPCPVVIFSHGLGGSREGYAYLGESWASHGYISVHLQHLGSDDAVWRDQPRGKRRRAMRKAVADIDNSLVRPADVSFAIDRLEILNADAGSEWHGKIDLDRIGVAGHSYGAFTTMAIAGQRYVGRDGRSRSLADDRIRAAIAMSSQAPRDPETYDESYAEISIPIFHMTGTDDTSPIGLSKSPADRRIAYDHTPGPADGGPDTYLLTFTDGDHMIFSGRPRTRLDRAGKKDKLFQRHIKDASLAFWNAYLLGDETARGWLQGNGFREELDDAGVFEVKK